MEKKKRKWFANTKYREKKLEANFYNNGKDATDIVVYKFTKLRTDTQNKAIRTFALHFWWS